MNPCARCGEESSSEILTACGSIAVCEHCSLFWFAMLQSEPLENFYGEV